MDARVWVGFALLAGVVVTGAVTQTYVAPQAKAKPAVTAASRMYEQWEDFKWPRQQFNPVQTARQTADQASARNRGVDEMIRDWESQYAMSVEDADANLKGKSFRLGGKIDEYLKPDASESLVIFIGPSPRSGWSTHMVINVAGNDARLGRGVQARIQARFAGRMEDEANRVVTYMFEEGQVMSAEGAPAPASPPAGAAPRETPGAAAPAAGASGEAAQTGAFADATKGWRFGGTVGALNGHLAVFLSPDDKPVFARVGGKLAEGITVKRLDSGWAQLSVDGKPVVISPWSVAKDAATKPTE
ncbi:MAG: hypothetical protein ACK5P9_09525 [Armatimonadota bacterium]